MNKILWDKLNKRECLHQYFFDQYGDCYINTDPMGVDMSGRIKIREIQENDVQYEVIEKTKSEL
jgi:hypothetical protein